MNILAYIGFFAFACFILYLVVRPRRMAVSQPRNDNAIALFKLKSESYLVEFDDCQFMNSSFSEEVEEDTSSVDLAASLVGGGSAIYRPLVKQEHIQAVLFYQNNGVLSGQRVYQTFPADVDALKFYVLDKKVRLYILKDGSQYFFDIESYHS
jgi:hypothetical protein